MQELIVIDDLLSALVGIEGRYTSIRRVLGKDDYVTFQVDASMDLALQVSIFPLPFVFDLKGRSDYFFLINISHLDFFDLCKIFK